MIPPLKSWPRLALLAGLLVALVHAPAVRAAPPRVGDRPATEGVERLIHDYSSEGDASSLELNPAMLSAIDGLDMTVLGYQTTSDFTRGSGFGGFFAANLGFGLAMGFGVQGVRPGLTGDFDPSLGLDADHPQFTKYSFGFSGGDRRFGGFGAAIHGVRSGGRWLRRPDLDVGTMFRIFNYGAVGISARFGPVDLNDGPYPSEVILSGELAIRPLGTHHLELAGGLRSRLVQDENPDPFFNQTRSAVLPRGRIAVRYQGLALKGEVEQIRAVTLTEDLSMVTGDERAVRGSVSLETSWDFLTVGGGLHSGVAEDDPVDGFGLYANFTTARRGRAVWARRVAAERIQLSELYGQRGLIEMLQRLERAEAAGNKAVIVLDARDVSAGWASLHEVREALVRIRNAGGHVYAYLEYAGLKEYYVASVAERIYMHPAGELAITGLSSTSLYFTDALDKIGVKVEAHRRSEYKTAPEPFTRNGPSAADLEQRNAYLDDVYGQIVYDIARGRGLGRDGVRSLVDAAPHGPQQALDRKLVDEIIFRDQVTAKLSNELGADVSFARFPETDPKNPTWSTHPYIGVVLVEGTIVDGPSRNIPFIGVNFAGGDTIAQSLRSLRADPACRGIVLRVDSPGGSALASDIIWREVDRTRQAFEADPRYNPPIVVSMSNVAASGGYYVAMGSRDVFVDPMTLTGSIGVLSLHFDVSGLLGKLGISARTLDRGKDAGMTDPFHPYSAAQAAKVEASLDRTYGLFKKRVATGRDLDAAAVEERARGRIYSGKLALERGLADRAGGLREAVAHVRALAEVRGFRDLRLRVVPKQPTLLDLILDVVGGPSSGNGPLVKRARARQRAKARLPLALDEALAKIPLSVLYLPQDRASTLMPAMIELD